MSRRIAPAFTAAVMTALILSSCGNEEASDEQQTAAVKLIIKASNYKFDQTEYRVKGNQPVQFILDTTGNHGITIEELDLSLHPTQTNQVVTPVPGSYKFECDIACGPGHQSMKATLIVE